MTEPLQFTIQANDDNSFTQILARITQRLDSLSESMDRLSSDLSTGFDRAESQMRETSEQVERLGDRAEDTESSIADMTNALQDLDEALERNTQELDHFGKATKDSEEKSSAWAERWDKVQAGLVASAGIIAGAIAGVGALTQEVTSNAVEVDNWARRLGTSVEWMSKMRYAASTVGLDVDGLGEVLTQVSEKLSEAANEGGQSADVFAELGISVRDASGRVREIDEFMPELADKLKMVSSDTDRARIATQLFGEEGGKIVPVLLQGSEGLDAFGKRADALGVTLNDKLVKDSREFQRGISDMLGAVQGLGQGLVAELLPSLNEVLPQIIAWVDGLKESSIVQGTVLPLLRTTVEVVGVLAENLGLIETGWNLVNAAFNYVVAGFLRGVELIQSGLHAVLEGASKAAEFLKMEGVAAGLQAAADKMDALKQGTAALKDTAMQTAEEWLARNKESVESTANVTAKVDETSASVKKLGDQAAATGKIVRGEMQTVEDILAQTKNAWTELGLEIPEVLKRTASVAASSLRHIAGDSQVSALDFQKAWEAAALRVEEAYGTLPPAMQQAQKAIESGNIATARAILSAWDGSFSGIIQSQNRLPPAAKRDAEQVRDHWSQGATDAQGNVVRAFEGMVTDINGRLVPALTANMVDGFGQITAAGREQAAQIRAAYEASLAAVDRKVTEVATNAERELGRIRDPVEKLLGTFDVIEFEFGQTAAALEAQYAEILRSFGELGQRAATIGGDFLRQQQQQYNSLLDEIQRRLRGLQDSQQRTQDTYSRQPLSNAGAYDSPGTPNTPFSFGFGLPGAQHGGIVPGVGGPDSVVIRATPGEHMIPDPLMSEMLDLLRSSVKNRQESRGEERASTLSVTINGAGLTPRQLVDSLVDELEEAQRRGRFVGART